ncbi:hypothetical protein GGS24DRAFT_481433 [Hypoxylon argillaceum]|nr:hypothetical protein GGS24DRAFT_481433 [Hypoxylon argillaceum]
MFRNQHADAMHAHPPGSSSHIAAADAPTSSINNALDHGTMPRPTTGTDTHAGPGPEFNFAQVPSQVAATSCECELETVRLLRLCQRPAAHPPSPPEPSSSPLSMSASLPSSAPVQESAAKPAAFEAFLASTLAMAHNLVQHWGTINGCSSAHSHITPRTLCSMTDAIGMILRDHELAVDAMYQLSHRNGTAAASERLNTPRASIGKLELDPSEAAIVIQESLKHSIIRLAAMLQDIEEEAALRSQDQLPLRDKDVKGLITRLFRMLANVNRIATA